MNEMGNTSDKPHKKSANCVGEVMGKYHPHGDSSIYGTVVRLAQPWAMRYCLVDGHGNFGSVDGDGAAAMRYTEVRLARLGEVTPWISSPTMTTPVRSLWYSPPDSPTFSSTERQASR